MAAEDPAKRPQGGRPQAAPTARAASCAAPAGTTKVTDGPYAEAREVIGGLFIIEANSYDEIVELSKDCPHLDFGSIEIREVDPT